MFLALALALGATTAAAAKVDKFAATYQQMDAASQRYREAQVELQNGDDAAMAKMSKALEDIEDLALQCLKQKGCEATRVVTVYETLLKEQGLGPELGRSRHRCRRTRPCPVAGAGQFARGGAQPAVAQ